MAAMEQPITGEERLRRELAERAQEEQGLMNELRSVGVVVQGILGLSTSRAVGRPRGSSAQLKTALPVLVRHLKGLPHSDGLSADIVRVLRTKECVEYWDVLVALFENPLTHNLPFTRQALAYTIACLSKFRADGVQTVLRLLRDPSLGEARVLLLIALGESKNPSISGLVKEFVADPVLALQASWYLEHPGKKSR